MTQQTNNAFDFYEKIKAFSEFSELSQDSHFYPVPDNWSVIITDIKGSTQAIQNGRYRDVNLLGAATITCIANLAPYGSIPFVFGGDGATLIVPDSIISEAMNELQSLQSLGKKQFGLEIRVGYVSMKKLRQLGCDLFIGKYQLATGNETAQFKGGALALAEKMVKKNDPVGAVLIAQTETFSNPRLEGLSCRLEPLESKKGLILSILVKPMGSEPNKVLERLLREFKVILDNDFLSANPVRLPSLRWRLSYSTVANELKLHPRTKARIRNFLNIFIRVMVSSMSLRWSIPLGPFKPRIYKGQLIRNSDFKKYDEVLRMVLDCSHEQSQAIKNFLNHLREKKLIAFGIHESKRALMTCMVRSAVSNQHIHFVDGDGGGYAMAALQLKQDLSSG